METTGAVANISGTTKLIQVNTYYDVPAIKLSLSGHVKHAAFLKDNIIYTSNANSTTWYNYDDKGRVTWMVKQIAGLAGYKTVNYTYDWINHA